MSTLESEQAMSSVTPTKTGVFHRILPQQTEDMTVRWARTTLGSMIAVCVISIALEVWIIILELQAYTSFDGVNEEAIDPNDMSKNIGNFIIGLTYHAVFIGSVLFQLFVTWNGLLHQNSLQIISINIYNISLWIYSITQIIQTRKDLDALYDGIPYDFKPFLAAMLPLAIVTGAFIPIYAYLTYRLRLEFAWRMYRITGGEKRVKDIFTTYHILLLLNKYAFCFVVGFTFLHLVLTPVSLAGLISIPLAVAIVGVAVTLFGHYAVRNESKGLMFLYFFGCLAGFGFLIERMYNTLSRGNTDFKRIEIPFLMYSSIALSLSFASFICGLFCWFNFGKGLKQVLMQETKMRSGQLEAPVIDLDA